MQVLTSKIWPDVKHWPDLKIILPFSLILYHHWGSGTTLARVLFQSINVDVFPGKHVVLIRLPIYHINALLISTHYIQWTLVISDSKGP